METGEEDEEKEAEAAVWGGHCSAIVTGWKGSADVICPQWLFGKSNCGDIGGSIVWIFCLECPVCVVLRGGQEI